MFVCRRFILAYSILLVLAACSSSTTVGADEQSCTANILSDWNYLMAFHGCESDCSSPQNHDVYLAGSSDGIAWQLIPEFESFAGSVPEIIAADENLLIFTPDGVKEYDACLNLLAEGEVALADDDANGYVDPSLIVDNNGDTRLFYLPGVSGQDPAGCASYPCNKEIHSAAPTAASVWDDFTSLSDVRVSTTLSSGTFSDPEIIQLPDGTYALYVSSGQSVLVYTSDTLDGSFSSPDGVSDRTISNNSGGIPSAVINTDGNIYLYVASSNSGIESIRMAESADGLSVISDSEFNTVVSATISEIFSASASVSSPSVIRY